jgi:hypothetical protein
MAVSRALSYRKWKTLSRTIEKAGSCMKGKLTGDFFQQIIMNQAQSIE